LRSSSLTRSIATASMMWPFRQNLNDLFDHFVGASQRRRRHIGAKRLGAIRACEPGFFKNLIS